MRSASARADRWGSKTARDLLVRTLAAAEADGTLAEAQERTTAVVLRYLREQGVLDGTRNAFADVGCRGLQHGVLLEL